MPNSITSNTAAITATGRSMAALIMFMAGVDKNAVDRDGVDKDEIDKNAVDKDGVDKGEVDKGEIDKDAVDKNKIYGAVCTACPGFSLSLPRTTT